MNRTTRVIVALATFVIASMLVSPAVGADSVPPPAPTPPPCTECEGEGDVGEGVISATVEIFVNGEAVPGRPGQVVDNPYADCTFTLYEAGETAVLHPIADANHRTWDVPHWVVFCPPQVIAYTFFPEGDPPPPFVRDDLVAAAYAATPVVAFNPQSSPNGDDDIPHVTQLLAFLWVEDALWVPVGATAQLGVAPTFSVTTTAIPSETVWRGGDEPTEVICDQGTPYQFGIGGDDAQDQSCTTIFKQSSAVETHKLELSASWDVSYTCSWGCGTNPLPDLVTNSEREVVVAEIQAIERS